MPSSSKMFPPLLGVLSQQSLHPPGGKRLVLSDFTLLCFIVPPPMDIELGWNSPLSVLWVEGKPASQTKALLPVL